MFDVSSNNPQAQLLANRQKAMLVNTFEQMKIEEEMEKIIDSIVETGESTIFVGWQTKTKVIRRPQTIEEQLTNPSSTILNKQIDALSLMMNAKKELNLKDNHNTHNYIIKGDPVSTSSKHVGNTILLSQNSALNHSVSNYVSMWA